MLKIVAMVKFRQDKPYEECRTYWNEVHSTVIPRCLPECRRYIQNIPVDIKSKKWVVDGVAELWFDDMDSIRRSFEGDLAEQLREDELNFADSSQSNWVIVNEKEVIALSPRGRAES